MTVTEQQQIERGLSEIGIGALFGDGDRLWMLWVDDGARLETFRAAATQHKPWYTREARDAKR